MEQVRFFLMLKVTLFSYGMVGSRHGGRFLFLVAVHLPLQVSRLPLQLPLQLINY